MNKNKFSKINIKTKRKIIFFLILIVLAISVGSVYALFSDKKEENQNLKIGKIDVVLNEDKEWEEGYDELGLDKFTKAVEGVSIADGDAYVRIRCIPVVEYFDGNYDTKEGSWVTAPISQNDIRIVLNSDSWIQSGEYWYYKDILKGKQTTSKLNISWQILSIPSEISNYKIRSDVRVILEYAQTTNDKWKDIFKIEKLPDNVEKVE